MIRLIILNPKETLFEGNTESVLLPGDKGDFEILPFHKPIISLLRKGTIVIDGHREMPISRGVVRVRNDQIVALVEPREDQKPRPADEQSQKQEK
jgi:F-type H+-transporting ATPase subunit epsilon